MTRDDLTAIAIAWMARVWRDRDIDAIDELHASGFIDRSPAGRARSGGRSRVSRCAPDYVVETMGFVERRVVFDGVYGETGGRRGA
jgi:hypothetical protein